MGIGFSDAAGPPGLRIYAIGDVHGRLDLLEAMHEAIGRELAAEAPGDWRIVHLGDYVDRGPDSRGVLEFLVRRSAEDPRVLSLCGNHDAGMLDFLARPDRRGLFARFGGRETARSYGVAIDFGSPPLAEAGAAALAAAVPREHRDFLSALPRSLSLGDFFFCHAGIRPGVPLHRQAPEDLIWIREPFLGWPQLHPKVIVHGHTPSDEAEVLANRVNVDTMAWESGRLTALVIDGAAKRLLEVAARGAAGGGNGKGLSA